MAKLEDFRKSFASKSNEQLEVIVHSSPSKSEEHIAAYNILIERRIKQAQLTALENEQRLKTNLAADYFKFFFTWGIFTVIMSIIIAVLIIWVVFF